MPYYIAGHILPLTVHAKVAGHATLLRGLIGHARGGPAPADPHRAGAQHLPIHGGHGALSRSAQHKLHKAAALALNRQEVNRQAR